MIWCWYQLIAVSQLGSHGAVLAERHQRLCPFLCRGVARNILLGQKVVGYFNKYSLGFGKGSSL